MASVKQVNVYQCDGCKILVPEPPYGEKPKGFHGKVEEIHPDGNSGVAEFFAHSDRCLKNAIVNVTM